MRQFFYQCFQLKNVVLISCALSLSVISKGQTTTPQVPAKAAVSDDDMDSDSTATADNVPKAKGAKKNDNKFIVLADFGGASIYTNSNGATTDATGLTWGASGQLAHQFKVKKSKSTRLFLSFGIELRNFNGTLSAPDGVGGTAYDNYHYWYAGIPVMFQVVSVKHKTGALNDVGFYAQAGLALGFKVAMLDVYSIQGNNSWNDVNDNYTALMLNGSLSAGVAYKTKTQTYLLGPYVGYVGTNISKTDWVTENVLSYGARLSVLLFK